MARMVWGEEQGRVPMLPGGGAGLSLLRTALDEKEEVGSVGRGEHKRVGEARTRA